MVNYKNAPISEVSFGLAFTPLDGFRTSHYGLFWDQIRSDYPETVDQLPLIRAEEMPPIVFSENRSPFPLPRCWYIHKDRNLLIQLQANRIWLNWRRLAPSPADYPHFPALFARFRHVVGLLREFLLGANVGILAQTAFDLVYVNHIPAGKLWTSYGDVGRFMRDVALGVWQPASPRP